MVIAHVSDAVPHFPAERILVSGTHNHALPIRDLIHTRLLYGRQERAASTHTYPDTHRALPFVLLVIVRSLIIVVGLM